MSSLLPSGRVRALLSEPHVRPFMAFAVLGRLSYGTVGFALLLLLEQATGSYAIAGAGLVAYGLTGALLAPPRARLVDRRGRRSVLPALAAVTAVLLLAVAALAGTLAASPVLLVGLTGLAGCFLPPLGPVTRGAWADAAGDADELRAAYSLDTVAEEGLFTAGPLLVGVVVALADPRAAVLLTAVLMLVGSLGMALSGPPGAAAPQAAQPAASEPAERRRLLRVPGFGGLLFVMFGAGLGLGGVELATVAFADGLGGTVNAGALLAVLSLGSAAGGTVFGVRSWAGPAALHLAVGCGALGLALAGVAAASRTPNLVLFGAAVFVLGLFVAPVLVAAYTAADALSGTATRTQASSMIGTVNNLGTALGTAATGVVLDVAGPTAALMLGAGALALTALAALRLRRRGACQAGPSRAR